MKPRSLPPELPPEVRKRLLLARSDDLRRAFAHDARVLERPLALADQGMDAARWLRRHPEWPIGAAALLVALRPMRAFRWGRRIFFAWRTGRRLLRWLDDARRAHPGA